MKSPEKSRVVFLNFWAADMGGAEYSLLELMDRARHRFETYLITSERGTLVACARRLGITCHVIPCGRRMQDIRRTMGGWCLAYHIPELFSYVIHVLRLTRLLRRLTPAVTHANVPKSHIALLLAHRFGFRGRKVLHFREIFAPESFPPKLYTMLYPATETSAICISEAVRVGLPQRIGATASVIHNGTPRIEMKDQVRTPRRPIRLLYLGRIVPWKGCDQLLEVLKQAAQRFGAESIRLSLVGPTSYWDPDYRRELCEETARLKIESIVSIEEETLDVDAVYQKHDLFVTASSAEPFGRSVAEASAHGLPVVGWRSGGIPEIVEEGKSGYLVDEGNIRAFVENVGRFVRHPRLVPIMGRRGRERMRRYFQKETQISKVLEFIQSGRA